MKKYCSMTVFIVFTFFEKDVVVIVYMLFIDNTKLGPTRSKRGNLGPCPRPWRRFVTDPPTHSY